MSQNECIAKKGKWQDFEDIATHMWWSLRNFHICSAVTGRTSVAAAASGQQRQLKVTAMKRRRVIIPINIAGN